jgi:hypothetical protein
VVHRFADVYSLSISTADVEALIAATRIQAEAKKFGGPEKFLAGDVLSKALGKSQR